MLTLCVKNRMASIKSDHVATLCCRWRSTHATTSRLTRHSIRAGVLPSRRSCLGASSLVVGLAWVLQSAPAQAGFLENLVKASQSEDISALDATVRLLDGVSILKQVQTLADSPAESELRFKSRAVLPGYAKYLREVGPAVKVILDSQGLDYDAQLSSRYGGAGDDISPAEALLERIGATITLSGRTVSPEALEPGSKVASKAAESLKVFLATVPDDLKQQAKKFRIERAERVKR